MKRYESTYVACLDILGFKDIVLGHSHEHLESLYLRAFCGTIEHALSNGKYILQDDGDSERIGPDTRQAAVNSILVSDSIVIWTNDGSAESFSHIVTAVRNLLALSMMDGIPLRGAISTGPLTWALNQWPSQTHNFQHSLFGKAIVEAVSAEKQQEWCGCMIDEAAIESYKSNCSGGHSLIENKLILSYPIPTKDGEVEGYAVDWVNHPQAPIHTRTVVDAFAPHMKPEPAEWEKIKRKLENTLKFVKYVKPSANQEPVRGIWAR
jgi:hypothetical protein